MGMLATQRLHQIQRSKLLVQWSKQRSGVVALVYRSCTRVAPLPSLALLHICVLLLRDESWTKEEEEKEGRKKKTNKDKQINTYEVWLTGTGTGTGTDIGTRMNGRGIAPAEPSECEDARKELLLTRDESRQISCR